LAASGGNFVHEVNFAFLIASAMGGGRSPVDDSL